MLSMSEAQLQRGLIEAAELHGWRVYHVTNVRTTLLIYNTTAKGYPDLTMVHERRGLIVYAELKNATRDKKAAAHQQAWATAIAMAARFTPERVLHCLWRPQHYDDALAFIAGETDTPPNRTTVNLHQMEWS